MCKICDEDPTSHSFEFIGETTDAKNIYYTCPSKATKYWDTKGILSHYEELLDANNNHHWIWVFDSQGFGLKHSMEFATALGLLKILKKHNESLCEIRIINPTIYIKSFYGLLKPFINQDIIDRIIWVK